MSNASWNGSKTKTVVQFVSNMHCNKWKRKNNEIITKMKGIEKYLTLNLTTLFCLSLLPFCI